MNEIHFGLEQLKGFLKCPLIGGIKLSKIVKISLFLMKCSKVHLGGEEKGVIRKVL